MKKIVTELAANVVKLKSQPVKQRQVHLLCQSLIALIKGGKA